MLTSKRIRSLREAHGLTQSELAAKLSITQPAVYRYENGRIPDSETLCKIADIFGVTVDYLLGRDKPLPKEAKTILTLKDGRTVSIDDLPPEDQRIVEELQAFIAAKLARTDTKK